jgi:hypothetical protein
VEVPSGVVRLYKLIQRSSGAVGGYGHDGPIYGEVTMGSFHKVVEYLQKEHGLCETSSFLDIGAGLGKPNLHVAVHPGVKYSFGIELEELRWQLSMHNLRQCINKSEALKKVQEKQAHPNVFFTKADVTNVRTFSPFTHVYMFDVGFPPVALIAVANAFNRSKTVRVLVSFTKPRNVIKYGFKVRLVHKITTRMCGSSETHTAYVYQSIPNNSHPSTTVSTVLQSAVASEENDFAPRTGNLDSAAQAARSVLREQESATPSKRKRNMQTQTQLDRDFFRSAKKRSSSRVSKVAGAEPLTATPRTLFHTSRSETGAVVDSVFKLGFDMVNGSPPCTVRTFVSPGLDTTNRTSSPAFGYSDWVESAGVFTGGTLTRRANMARVLSY